MGNSIRLDRNPPSYEELLKIGSDNNNTPTISSLPQLKPLLKNHKSFEDILSFDPQDHKHQRRRPTSSQKEKKNYLNKSEFSYDFPTFKILQTDIILLFKIGSTCSVQNIDISAINFNDTNESVSHNDCIFALIFKTINPNQEEKALQDIKLTLLNKEIEFEKVTSTLELSNTKGKQWIHQIYFSNVWNGSHSTDLSRSISLAKRCLLKQIFTKRENVLNLTSWFVGDQYHKFSAIDMNQIQEIQNERFEKHLVLKELIKFLAAPLKYQIFALPNLTLLKSFYKGPQELDSFSEEDLTSEQCRQIQIRSETVLKKKFEPICSKIADYLFLGSKTVAENEQKLRHYGITDILNCAGADCKNAFPDQFKYTTLYVNDTANAEISKFFLLVIELIENVREKKGKIFVHCNKGISRSPAFVIAYIMWLRKCSHQEALSFVQTCRFIADPNINFSIQLKNLWNRVLKGETSLHRMAPHAMNTAPQFNLPVQEHEVSAHRLDPRTIFLLISKSCNWIWIGKEVESSLLLNRAHEIVKQFQKYFEATQSVAVIRQGNEHESLDFLKELGSTPETFYINRNTEYDEDYEGNFQKFSLSPAPRKNSLSKISPRFEHRVLGSSNNNNTLSNSKLVSLNLENESLIFNNSNNNLESLNSPRQNFPHLYQFNKKTKKYQVIDEEWDQDDFQSNGIYLVDVPSLKKLAIWIGSKANFPVGKSEELAKNFFFSKPNVFNRYRISVYEESVNDQTFFDSNEFFLK